MASFCSSYRTICGKTNWLFSDAFVWSGVHCSVHLIVTYQSLRVYNVCIHLCVGVYSNQ